MHQFKISFLFLLSLVGSFTFLQAQDSTQFSTYYFQRLTHFRTLPQTSDDIIFMGNSITDGAEWSELFNDSKIINRGISGDITGGVLYRLKEVTDRKPDKIFLMIGVNDLAGNEMPDNIASNIFQIAKDIRNSTPATALYIQSILPVNNEFPKFPSHVNKSEQIKRVNQLLKDSASFYHYTFIDLHPSFADASGKLNTAYTNDGLHLKGDGYLHWQQLIYPYVYDAEPKPSLIPLPQNLEWQTSYFPLYRCKTIIVKDTTLKKEAERLQTLLKQKGWNIAISNSEKDPFIGISLGKVEAPQLKEEAYTIDVTPTKVFITANTSHGVFNAIQTLMQLMRDNTTIPACSITDWPAFSWRGYMIDVGRNYMPMDLLKQQIETMSNYKLNIFHFHLTEDIAWRLAIKKYPQLTDAKYMERDKGEYYSEEDMKELIAFCKDRYITLVPEIDMPGHSAAFRRAMKTDMQSDSGLMIIKDILQEVFETYDLPYIHIGADEVRITNQRFLPEVISFIRQYNKKIIGWEPGGNFTGDVIRQLWMDDEAALSKNSRLKFIDSRHLYLNHMDPLEAVTTIFFRKIGNEEKGDSTLLGATLCMWPDRRVAEPINVFRMNPVYPGIVTFSERVWRGGGEDGWTAIIGEPGSESAKKFAAFEDRLMDHKRQYFSKVPFPYVRQSADVWTLFGPYDNRGDLSKKLVPEIKNFDTTNLANGKREVGGTIVLRHWWFPLIHGVFDSAKENSTVYATRNIWSDTDGWKSFWIGFNNLSRSPATDPPPKGKWDNKQSEVWVNGKLVAPPDWKHGGQKGNSEIPLVDEGYEYREPTKIFLNKGWNTVDKGSRWKFQRQRLAEPGEVGIHFC